MTMLPLLSPRLTLRAFTMADVQAFLAYRNDPDVARYQSWESCSPAEAMRLVVDQHGKDAGAPGEWRQIAIALRETDALIGDCALKVHAPEGQQAIFGITLAQSHQGQGYAYEALACLFDHLFMQMELHRVTADTDVLNTRSWRLMERLGMRREAHHVQSLWFKGRWADEYLYAILREEWLAAAKR